MTFKHTKFDSPTLRALEKVAVEKGLVKPEPLEKKAAATKKADYTPTPNFMENIFKLCAGLRASGLSKEATEIEMNYLSYKQAQTLYETSKEKGEDLVGAAHPKGSHKLEGVEGDEAKFEDIIDQHLKIMKVVDKKPTGKLSDASSILKAVKKALGQGNTLEEVKALAREFMEQIRNISNLSNPELYIDLRTSNLEDKMNNPTVYNIQAAKNSLNMMYKRLDPSIISGGTWGVGGLSDYTWGRVKPLFSKAYGILATMNDKRRAYDDSEQNKLEGRPDPNAPPPTPKAEPGADLFKKIQGLAAQYDAYSNQISSDDPKDAESLAGTKTWLKQKAGSLRQLAAAFQGETDKEAVSSVYQATLNKYQTALAKTQQDWA